MINGSRHPQTNELTAWLQHAIEREASDLHLMAGFAPVIRRHGELKELETKPVDADLLLSVLKRELHEKEWIRFQSELNLDFSMDLHSNDRWWRCRVNLFFANKSIGACLRLIPNHVPSLEWCGLPRNVLSKCTSLQDGLVIVSGATGSGKSTTLAVLIQNFLKRGNCRVITIEEPIEFIYESSPSTLVSQREVGIDVRSFAEGLKYGLRQDPDIIMVGEIRDRETAQMAISAAETGHLVLSTLHTRDTKGVLSRLCDFFPIDAQREIRSQLAMSLRCVIGQRLLPSVESGSKRALAVEFLWNSNAIASSIRLGKFEAIDNTILTSRDEGMISFDESIRSLLREGFISRSVAESNVSDTAFLARW